MCSMSCVRVVQFSPLSPQDGYLVSSLVGSSVLYMVSHDSHMIKHHSHYMMPHDSHMTKHHSHYMMSHDSHMIKHLSRTHSPSSPSSHVDCLL